MNKLSNRRLVGQNLYVEIVAIFRTNCFFFVFLNFYLTLHQMRNFTVF